MSHPKVIASLEEFARSGDLGPIRFGQTKQEIAALLGPPTDWYINIPNVGDVKGVDDSPIWRYGNVEMHWETDDTLGLIHVDDGFGVPMGSPTFIIEPWGLREGLGLDGLTAALRIAGIGYSIGPDPNPESVRVVTQAGVVFCVVVNGEHQLGLVGFWKQAPLRHGAAGV